MPRKILYLFYLFAPTSFIGLFSPAVLVITLPIFLQNLLSLGYTHAQIYYQYVAMLIPFIFTSVIFTFRKILNNKKIYRYRNIMLFIFLGYAVYWGIYLKAPQLYFLKHIKSNQINDFTMGKDRLVKAIPKDAEVIATFQFLPKLASRPGLYSLHFVSTGFKMHTQVAYVPPGNLQYALVDFNEPLMVSSFFPPQAPENIRSFLEKGNWRLLRGLDDIVLFKKDYQEGFKLCEMVQNPVIGKPLNANIGGQIIFLGYDFLDDAKAGKNILHFVYYWKHIGATTPNLIFFTQFLDSRGNSVFSNLHSFGYRIYPPESIAEGQIMKEHYYIFFPPSLKKGSYSMRAGVFSLDDAKLLPVSNKGITDNLGRIILGEFRNE